ncbi:RHS repeat protein [Agrobacterium tumefaciens]|uniref:RHS repeat protein n=1 Tax=Agrobacterium tumefaciens TaxID=358 RepID=A0AAP9E2H8_AGRTU|nr:RHS repeat-associated core domain-containing protein [Agrobacterium tumefaciens]NSZ57477.1 RHS repeat protein [Agrobacterium tumefaciens]QDY93613.1 RHS repeat protein [Agrobacterium tumefaciens]UXS48681.1 RHS repeat protein [Agrobacterium tumefaciens]UXS69986.1 RHS repeat protein [Agrobacterium tumefaciens]UXS77649.1 RHS repeat protein [Agrobacterium tumefaciens]
MYIFTINYNLTHNYSRIIVFTLLLFSSIFLPRYEASAAVPGFWETLGKQFSTPDAACEYQWNYWGMNNGYSRFIGAFDRPGHPFSKDCSWTSFQYLCPKENRLGGGLSAIAKCWTVLPSIVSFACPAGYNSAFPYACVKNPDYPPQRPECSSANGGRPNPSIGNPIILASGTKYHETEDFSTSDGKLSVSRTYRSQPLGRNASAQYMPMGLPSGWQFNFAMEIQLGTFSGSPASGTGNLTLIAPDGSAYDFSLSKSGDWISNPSSGMAASDYSIKHVGSLPSNLGTIKSTATKWIVTGPDDRKWSLQTMARVNSPSIFDVARPLSVADRSGYTWNYQYDNADYRLLSITDTYSRVITFTWSYFHITSLPDISGSRPFPEAISRITFPDGTAAVYAFDLLPAKSTPSTAKIQRLMAIRWVDAANTTVDSESYHYDDTRFRHALTGISDNRGTRTGTYSYDAEGRAISTAGATGSDTYTVEYGKSDTQDLRRVTNPLGKSSTYRFSHVDTNNFELQLTEVDGEASSNCVASNVSFTYDNNGYLATQTDEEGRVTGYTRDNKGRTTKIVEAKGTASERSTAIVWHTTYNAPQLILTSGLTTALDYDATGRLSTRTETDNTKQTVPYSTNGQSRTWSYTYSSNGHLTSVDGPAPGPADRVSYTYDRHGNIETFTNENGHLFTVLATNGRGLPTLSRDPNNIEEALAYDARGRLISRIVDPSGLAAETSIEYDATGNIAKFIEPNGSVLSFEYDDNNRVTKLSNNMGDSITYTHDLMGNTILEETKDADNNNFFKEQKSFDELGRLLQIVRAGSATWAFGYDKIGNNISVTDPSNNSSTSAYDSLNRLVSFLDERKSETIWAYGASGKPVSSTDPREVTTSYIRNGWNEVIQENSNDIGTIVYQRNQRGDIVSRTDAREIVTQFSYDDEARLVEVTYPANPTLNVTYTYDSGKNGIGRLTGVTDATGKLTKTYDSLGRVVEETRAIGSQHYTILYRWDSSGHLTQVTYPSGREVVYSRDANRNVNTVHTKSIEATENIELARWVSYSPFGPRQGLLHGNGITDWRSYDDDKRIVSLDVFDENTAPRNELVSRWYGYVDKRNLTHISENVDPSRNENYWYTSNGFLQNADGPWGSLTYDIDGAGNRIQRILDVAGSTTTENYEIPYDSNRLSKVLSNGVETRRFGWDAAGNIVSDINVTANLTEEFGYNDAGQLSSVAVNDRVTGQYAYDYLSRLGVRVLPATSTTLHYIYDLSGNIIAEYNDNGALGREYIWLDERPLAVVADAGSATPEIYQVHTDHLERPIMMTDSAKNVVWRATYLPYGEAYTILGSAALDQRFPGQWFQLESGLHYNWHRHYDPTTGRYLQADPLGMPDGPNRWAYVTNSPLMYVDPEGRQRKPKRGPIVYCPGVNGYECGAPVRPPSINPEYPNVCYQCLCRIGEWPFSGSPPTAFD